VRRLLIRPGAIGDVIVSLPALEALRANYTEVWAPDTVLPLIHFADRVRSIQSTGLSLLELGMAPESLRQTLASFDSIVSWYGTGREEFRDAVRAFPFQFHPALPEEGGEHAVDFYLRQVGAPLGALPRIPVPRWDGGFVALHPYSGSARKNWPFANFDELRRRLHGEWVEGPEPGRRRYDDLGAVARWLAGAACYVGNDSGISHLAAAVGIPVVALFGPTDPNIWSPRGPQVCVLPLTATVDEVERAVLECRRCAP
jgi:hypothetical protein